MSKQPMTIDEAVQKVAEAETLTGATAQLVLKQGSTMKQFCNMIYDNYHREGNQESMVQNYGQDVIDTIINYGEATKLISKPLEVKENIEFEGKFYHPIDGNINPGDLIYGQFLGDYGVRRAMKYRGSHLVRWGDVTVKEPKEYWTWSGETEQQYSNAIKVIEVITIK